jgi:TolA-binding protein
MSDLKLVAPDQPTPLERVLLDAAANESPSLEQRMRVRQALGLPALPALPPSPNAQPGRGAPLGTGPIAFAIVGSAALVALLFGVAHRPRALTPSPPAVPASAAAPSATPNTLSPALGAPGAASPPTAPASGDSRAATGAPAQPVTKVIPTVSARVAQSEGGDLSEQLRLMDAARSAVASGNASAASQALTAYASKFPRGSFGQEAAVLRIETIELQGNHAQAAVLAHHFLATHPNSPHVGLVRRIAGN